MTDYKRVPFGSDEARECCVQCGERAELEFHGSTWVMKPPAHRKRLRRCGKCGYQWATYEISHEHFVRLLHLEKCINDLIGSGRVVKKEAA